MKPKTLQTLYWVMTILFAVLMLLDGYGGISRQQAGIFGAFKMLGAVAILQTKFKTVKEWAYAGFAFNFIGAASSKSYTGDGPAEILAPIVALGILFIPYLLWKKYESVNIPSLQLKTVKQ